MESFWCHLFFFWSHAWDRNFNWCCLSDQHYILENSLQRLKKGTQNYPLPTFHLHWNSPQFSKTPKQKGDVWIFWNNQDDVLNLVSLFIPGFTVANAFASVGFAQPSWEHWTPGEPHTTSGAPSWKEGLSLVSMLPRKQHPELPFLIIQHILTSEQLYITSEV